MSFRSPRITPLWVMKCLTLGAFAVVAALFSVSQVVFALLVTVVSVFAVNELRGIVTQPHDLQFSRALAISILLGYVVGVAIYLGYFRTTDATAHQYWQQYGIYYSQQSLGLALAAVLGCCSLLYAMSAGNVARLR